MSISKEEVAKFDFDREALVKRILSNKADRDLVVEWITCDKNIMVYYQCFYLLQDATSAEPEKFIEYWDSFIPLLTFKNSYHRDIAVTILSNLISVDSTHKFDSIKSVYYSVIHDEKFKNAASCILCLQKVATARPDLTLEIFNQLIDYNSASKYPEKQNDYLTGVIALFFDSVFHSLPQSNRDAAKAFIHAGTNSKSPKTRAICKKLEKQESTGKQNLAE